jgi:hypothetical protein
MSGSNILDLGSRHDVQHTSTPSTATIRMQIVTTGYHESIMKVFSTINQVVKVANLNNIA